MYVIALICSFKSKLSLVMKSVRKDESTIPLCLSGTKNSADLINLVVRSDIKLLLSKTLKVLLQAIKAGCVVHRWG